MGPSGRPSGLALLSAVLLAVLLAACGGKSKAFGGLHKPDFLARGNAICLVLTQQLSSLPEPGADPQKVLTNINALVSIYQTALTQLRAVPEPKGDEVTLRALFAKVDAFIGLARQEGAALAAGAATVPQSLVDRTSAASTAASTAFNDYGLAACAP